MRISDEEILNHARAWKESGLTQSAYLENHLCGNMSLEHFRYRVHAARRKGGKQAGFIPVRVLAREEISLFLRGSNSLSLEWRGKDMEEVRRFALSVLS